MTIASAQARIGYAGSGTTGPFAVPWLFYDDADLLVTKIDTGGNTSTLTLNGDYTLTGRGNPGGGVLTKITPLITGEVLSIIESPPLTQLSHYVQNQPFPSLSVETGFDKLTQIAQRLYDLVTRAIRAPDADINLLPVLPSAAQRALNFLAFDASGNPVMSSGTGGGDAALRNDLANTTTAGKGSDLVAYRRTTAEVAASITPTSFAYPAGDTRRSNWYIYGDTAYLHWEVTPTYIDATHFSVPGDYTATFLAQSWVLLRGVSTRNVGRVTASPVFAAGVTTVAVGMDLGGNMPTDLLAAFPQVAPNLFVNNTFEVNANSHARMRLANRSTGNIASVDLNLGVDATNNTKGGFILGATGEGFSGEAISTSGITGACAYLYTNTTGVPGFVPIPFILACGDTPRLLIGDGVAAYPTAPKVLFINDTTAFRMIAPQEPGSIDMAFYRSNRTTRKGTIGFSSFVNNVLSLINEEAGDVTIQATNGNAALAASGSCSLNGSSYSIDLAGMPDYASDAAADAAGVPVSGVYTIGRALRIRR